MVEAQKVKHYGLNGLHIFLQKMPFQVSTIEF